MEAHGFVGDAAEPAVELSRSAKILAVLALSLAIVLFALDGTMVTVAVPRMVGDLGNEDLLSWIGTAYLLTSTAFGPLWGRLGDVLGRKALFLANIVVFMLASIICAVAPNMITLIVGRALQGVGGGGMSSLTYVLMADVVTMRERGTYQALMGSVAGVSAVLGPLLGGVITDNWNWRGIFWINLPVGAIAITFAWFTLKIPHVNKGSWKETLARIDYGGVILCVAGVVLFLFGLTSGISSSWTSARVIAPMIVGVFVFAGFIFWEAKFAKEPSLPMHLFKLPNIGMVYASFLFSGWNLQASAYFLPLFFQLVYGNTPTQAGIKTMPQIGALIPVSIIIGLITSKYGIYVPFPKVGLAIMAVGIGLCATWTATTPLGVQMAFMVIMGVGAGLTLSVLMVAVQANLPVADIGPGTTAATFTQTIGGVLGIAVAGAIMQTVTGAEITPEAIGGIAMTYNADPMELGAAIRGIVDGRPIVPTPTLPQAAIYAALALIQNAYVSGLTKAFISVAAASAVGWLVFLPVRHTALRTTMDNKGESKDEEVLSDEELKLEDIVVEDTKTVVDGEVPRAVEAEVAKN